MALWGNKDQIGYSKGTIAINLGTGVITGSGTTFATSGFELNNGDVITVGAGATYGEAVILSVTNDTTAAVASTAFLIADSTDSIPAGTSFEINQKPSYAIGDGAYSAPVDRTSGISTSSLKREVFGVDTTEQSVANAASGDARKYAPPHAGWVGVTTYYDQHGNFRVKTEVLVAGSSITNDATDDAQYPDS
jgi:hypothetical protein